VCFSRAEPAPEVPPITRDAASDEGDGIRIVLSRAARLVRDHGDQRGRHHIESPEEP
jgi:hypothetical protein